MKFTGERVIPGEGDLDLFNEHQARYRFAQRFSAGKTVLDAACGSGYGAALLGENAKAVFAMDISHEAADFARRHYGSQKITFVESDCMLLPFAPGQFDLVTAFEIIEHLQDAEGFLRELLRVLKPSGLLLLSTPNRLYYTDERGVTNPFHVREFSYPEFEQILQPLFPHRAMLFENHVPGVLLAGAGADGIAREGSVIAERAESGRGEEEKGAHYFVAVCSREPLDPITPLLYLPSTGNVLREREMHIRLLSGYLEEAKSNMEKSRTEVERLNESLDDRTRWGKDLDRQLSEKNEYIEQLQADYDAKVQWALSIQEDLDKARGALQELHAEYEKKGQWALSLEHDLEQARAAFQEVQADRDGKVQWALSLQQDVEQARAALDRLQKEFDERTAWALRLQTELEKCHTELRAIYGSRWFRVGKKLGLGPVERQ